MQDASIIPKLFLRVEELIGYSMQIFPPSLLSRGSPPASDDRQKSLGREGIIIYSSACVHSSRSEEIGPHLKVRAPDELKRY